MLEALQRFFPWAADLPPLAKVLLTLVIVGISALALVLIWSPTGPTVEPLQGEQRLWPANRTLDGLAARLDQVSAMDRMLVLHVTSAGRNGIYVEDLARGLGISRAETIMRAERLEKIGLIRKLPLTDLNFRPSEELKTLIGQSSQDAVNALLR